MADDRPAERMKEKTPSGPDPLPVPWLRVTVQCVGFRVMGATPCSYKQIVGHKERVRAT